MDNGSEQNTFTVPEMKWVPTLGASRASTRRHGYMAMRNTGRYKCNVKREIRSRGRAGAGKERGRHPDVGHQLRGPATFAIRMYVMCMAWGPAKLPDPMPQRCIKTGPTVIRHCGTPPLFATSEGTNKKKKEEKKDAQNGRGNLAIFGMRLIAAATTLRVPRLPACHSLRHADKP